MAIKFNTQRRAKWQRLKEQGARRMQAAITTIAAAPRDEAPADRRAGEQGRQMCSVVWYRVLGWVDSIMADVLVVWRLQGHSALVCRRWYPWLATQIWSVICRLINQTFVIEFSD